VPEGADSGGFKASFERLVGTSRQSRIVSAGTASAIVVAVVGFIALAPSSNDAAVPQDALTRALDARCVEHKAEIAAAQRQALKTGTLTAVSEYGESMVPIVGEWRMELSRADAPPDRIGLVDALRAALLEVEIEAGTLGRAARESNRNELATAAARVDAATSNVETAIHDLELERCGAVEIKQGRLVRQ
jgi:predicted outer membrane protein